MSWLLRAPLVAVLISTASLSYVGREFVTAFSENRVVELGPQGHLYVMSQSPRSSQVQIYQGMDYGALATYTLAPETSLKHVSSMDLLLSGTEVRFVGLRVISTEDISVQVSETELFSSDGYALLPVSQLHHTYLIMSYMYNGAESHIGQGASQLVVTNPDNFIQVTLTFPRAGFSIGDPYVGDWPDDQTMKVTLAPRQALQVQSDDDLTGTIVKATMDPSYTSPELLSQLPPVAVLAGSVWTSVAVERMGDHLVEQALATHHWGLEYLTVPTPTRSAGDVFRVLAAFHNTSVRVYNAGQQQLFLTFLLQPGEYADFELSSKVLGYVVCSRPALLAQLAKSGEADAAQADPFIVYLPATSQYIDRITFVTPDTVASAEDFTHYLTLFTSSDSISNVLLDDGPLAEPDFFTPWTVIGNTGYSFCRLSPSIGRHVVHMNPTGVFGALLSGLKKQESYAFVPGRRLANNSDLCASVEAFLRDHFDNDCDGRFDEEIANGLDDDGDGLIDEDVFTGNLSVPTTPLIYGSTNSKTSTPDDISTSAATTATPVATTEVPDVPSTETFMIITALASTSIPHFTRHPSTESLINTRIGGEARESTQTRSLVTTSADQSTSVWPQSTSSVHAREPVTTATAEPPTETPTTLDMNVGPTTTESRMSVSTSVPTYDGGSITTATTFLPNDTETGTTSYAGLPTTNITSAWTNITWLYSLTNSTLLNSSLGNLFNTSTHGGTTEPLSTVSDVIGVSTVSNASLILTTLAGGRTTGEPLVVTSAHSEYNIMSDEPLIIVLPVVLVLGCPLCWCLYVAIKALMASIRGKKSKVAPQQPTKSQAAAHEMKPRYKNRSVAFDGTKVASKGL